ncbi:HK97-gp10 family putative phage morphogenesis protein [Fictibacillus sp. JL2B1089]|uniref:HK97-gp10 family putative phage morphogenesis protein n=1 Tax=Fictibacillus sp. JL2B1089 TaxID=3399565 RepID=UPI003A8A1625
MADIELSGFEEMTRKLDELGRKAGRVENNALRAGAEVLQEVMSDNAPVDPNSEHDVHLKDNIQISKVKRKGGEKVIEVGPGEGSFYAMFLELGTSKMTPDPFVDRSIAQSKDKVIKAMADELRDGLGL